MKHNAGKGNLNIRHNQSQYVSKREELLINVIFIGPESDHWECLSVTKGLTDCCLVNLIDVTLACEDAQEESWNVTSAFYSS